jgi:exonuclease III
MKEIIRKKNKKQKSNRRSKTKKTSKTVDLKITQSNMDGDTSKKESLNDKAKEEAPDIFTLNDAALKGKLKVKVPNYFSFGKNREKHKGGVATVVANHLKTNAMKITEGKEEDDYIITRLDHTIPAINIVNIYGQQEDKTSNDEIEKSWFRLKKGY